MSASSSSFDLTGQVDPIQLNFTWIGPPSKFTEGLEGKDEDNPPIDLFGPEEMSKAIKLSKERKYAINFWCLDAFVSYYEDAFKGMPIKTRSIESFLKEKISTHPDLIAKLQDMKNTILANNRNRIRDRVTFKNLFSLYVLIAIGDYVLDTNVRPLDNGQDPYSLRLDRSPHFKMAKLPEQVNQPEQEEVWMLYSPSETQTPHTQNESTARKAFNAYYEAWQKAELIFQQQGYTQDYHETLGAEIVDRIVDSLPKPLREDYFFHVDHLDNDTGSAPLSNLGLEKQYYNTHDNYDVPAATSSNTQGTTIPGNIYQQGTHQTLFPSAQGSSASSQPNQRATTGPHPTK